jgi:hypothetical protein
MKFITNKFALLFFLCFFEYGNTTQEIIKDSVVEPVKKSE